MSQQRKRAYGFEKVEYMGEVEGREGRGKLCNYIIISKIKKNCSGFSKYFHPGCQ